VEEFTVTVEQGEDYEFRVRFDKPHYPEWRLDESAPVGQDRWPNAARILSAAIGDCLSASLLFCLRKAKVETGPIRTKVRAELGRSERGRFRVVKVNVHLDPRIEEAANPKALRCLDLFEDYCPVTQSIRDGVPVHVRVEGFPPGEKGEQD
jgi:organic hydroperoxide reductase OsmC/OhrA